MSRLDDAKIKYPNLDWNIWKGADPSKNNKYLDWIGKNHSKSLKPDSVKELIINFERRKDSLSEKDINKYTADVLGKELAKLVPSRKEQKTNGVIEVTDSSLPKDIKIVLLEGQGACKQYTAGTQWCISDFDTFLEYCESQNLFVVTKGDVKFCFVVDANPRRRGTRSLREIQIFADDDQDLFDQYGGGISSELFGQLMRFCGANDSIEICKKVCSDYTDNYRNFWFEQYNGNGKFDLTESNIDKILSLMTDERDIFQILSYDEDRAEEVVKFFFKHREKLEYKKMIDYLAKRKDYITIEDAEGEQSSVSCATYWKNLVNPPPPKPKSKKDEELLKKIKKAGGIGKLLKNKAILDTLTKQMKAEFPGIK